MTAYAVAHMRQATMGPQIVEYLHRIDATLEPFGGRFLVHGGDVEVIENSQWHGYRLNPDIVRIVAASGEAQKVTLPGPNVTLRRRA